MADDKISIVIETELDESKVRSSTKKTEDAFAKSGERAGDEFSKGATGKISTGLGNLAKTLGPVLAGLAAGFAGKEVLNAAKRQEDAINAVESSLKRIGEFTPEASAGLQAFASELQKVTTIGDEAALEQIAFAQSLGATTEQSKQIVAAAADLSAALNIDLNAATRNITKTLGGLKGELGEVIPELKNVTAEQLKAGAAIDILAAKFAGAANDRVNTFSGALAQNKNAFGDLLEQIGLTITKSPALIKAIQASTESFVRIGEFISGLNLAEGFNSLIEGAQFVKAALLQTLSPAFDVLRQSAISFFGSTGPGFFKLGQAIKDGFIPALVAIQEVSAIVFLAVRAGIDTLIAGVGALASGFGKLLEFVGADGALSTALIEFGETSAVQLEETIGPLSERLNNLFDAEVQAEKLEAFNETLLEGLNQTNQVIKKPLEDIDKSYSKTAQNVAKNTAAAVKEISFSMTEVLARSVSFGIQFITQSLISGTFSFDSFARGVLGIVGDMSIKLGEAAILTGIAMESLGTLSGTGAIIAGAGLIALGTIIKSFAGAGTGLGSGGAGTGGSPGFASGFSGAESGGGLAIADDGFTEQEAEREAPSTNVQVTINGSVFDSEETGTRLVGILNEAFDKQGVVVNAGAIA